MTATANAETSGNEAAKACDADRTTSWRHGAGSGTLTIPFGATRYLNRIDVQFDNGASVAGQNISVTLEAQSTSGSWSTLWTGTSYTQVLSRPLEPVQATAIRLTTNSQGVRQMDAFVEAPPYTRSDDGTTGNTTIEVPAYDALFRESLTGAVDLRENRRRHLVADRCRHPQRSHPHPRRNPETPPAAQRSRFRLLPPLRCLHAGARERSGGFPVERSQF